MRSCWIIAILLAMLPIVYAQNAGYFVVDFDKSSISNENPKTGERVIATVVIKKQTNVILDKVIVEVYTDKKIADADIKIKANGQEFSGKGYIKQEFDKLDEAEITVAFETPTVTSKDGIPLKVYEIKVTSIQGQNTFLDTFKKNIVAYPSDELARAIDAVDAARNKLASLESLIVKEKAKGKNVAALESAKITAEKKLKDAENYLKSNDPSLAIARANDVIAIVDEAINKYTGKTKIYMIAGAGVVFVVILLALLMFRRKTERL